MPSQNDLQHSSGSTIRHPPTKTSDCATEGEPARAHITDNGRITLEWQVSWTSPKEDRDPRLDEFTRRQIGELRRMSETADRQEVRRAARALLRWATGRTHAEAVVPTPYGIGWLRALRDDVAEHGIAYLVERDYRAPRDDTAGAEG